jgi:hypothetical protein
MSLNSVNGRAAARLNASWQNGLSPLTPSRVAPRSLIFAAT